MKFLKVFSHEEANKLPPWCPGVDHVILMQTDTQPPARPFNGMSRDKLEVFKKYLEVNLSKKMYSGLFFPTTAFVLFVKKPRDSLRFCVDYQGLNAPTNRNKYLLPLIWETLNCLCNILYFTELNIIRAFNCICMAAGEEWKTVFRICLGHYKYLVLPFGLSNGPGTFQNYIKDIFENNILDIFVTAYIDNILVLARHFRSIKSMSRLSQHIYKLLVFSYILKNTNLKSIKLNILD